MKGFGKSLPDVAWIAFLTGMLIGAAWLTHAICSLDDGPTVISMIIRR
jgi:hypothetical protein